MADGMRELPASCFPELAEVLKKDIPRSLMMLGSLQQMDRSLKVMDGHVFVSQWPDPDIVVLENTAYKVLMGLCPVIIYASCSSEKLKMTLEESCFRQLLTGKIPAEITGDPRCAELALEKCRQNSREVKVVALPFLSALTYPTNLLKCECPLGFHIAPLRVSDAPVIDRMWKFGGRPGGIERFGKLIRHSLAAGVFSKHTHELVTWAFISEYGGISFLHTLEAYRRKGLAKAVIYHLAKRLLDEGKAVFSVIEKENENSRQLFHDMGFTIFPNDFIAFLHILN